MSIFKQQRGMSVVERHLIGELERRVSEIENKVFPPSDKITATLSQKILMLEQLGLWNKILSLKLTNTAKSKVLSILLERTQSTIESELSNISPLKTTKNYTELAKMFEKMGLEDEAKKAENEARRLEKTTTKNKRV